MSNCNVHVTTKTMPEIQINRKLLLMKIHYFLGIGGYASLSTFLIKILNQSGYSAFIIGLIFILQPIPEQIITPIIGAVTDKYKCRRSVFISNSIIMYLLVCLLSIILGISSEEEMNDSYVIKSPLFWLFIITYALIGMCTAVKNILENTICMDLLGEEKYNYGKQRLWGSIGWSLLDIVSSVCVNWYSTYEQYENYYPAYIIALICFFLDIFVVCNIKVVQENNTKVLACGVKKIFTQTKELAFLLWVILVGFFMPFVWIFVESYLEDLSKLYHLDMNSWIKNLQGIILPIRIFGGEVPSFILSCYILQRVDHMTIFSIVFFIFMVNFSLYSVIQNPLWVLLVLSFNGIIFALFHSAVISYADHLAPAGSEGTLQGIVATAYTGIGASIGYFARDYMFKHMGSISSFKLLSVAAFFICAIQIIVNYFIQRVPEDEEAKSITSQVGTIDDSSIEEITHC